MLYLNSLEICVVFLVLRWWIKRKVCLKIVLVKVIVGGINLIMLDLILKRNGWGGI